MSVALEFEKPVVELRKRLDALEEQLAANATDEAQREHNTLAGELEGKLREIYGSLTPWQKVQVARHTQRPQTLDYAAKAFTEFVEFHGDRTFADDGAVVGGPARLDGRVVMLIGHQRGRDTRERLERNGGSPHPEGYRKAKRLFRLAEKFGMPVITLLDTAGAGPGLEDEERGQAWALAESIATMCQLRVPIISVVIGQGGSGGALAMGVGDRILMLEHAVFSVASPEAAASILWKDAKFAPQAAEAIKITALDLVRLGVVERIIAEPVGGAHSDPTTSIQAVRTALLEELAQLDAYSIDELLARRFEKYRRIGALQAA